MNDDDRAGEDDAEDRPLREDIRLLSRLLGDTLREQAGEQTFNLVEHVRQTAVRFRRTGDKHARAELEEISGSLTHDITESVA